LRGYAGARAFRIALQFNENIDSISIYTFRCLGIGHRPEIDEFVEGAAQPRAEFAAVFRPVRIGNDFETGFVVTLEEFGHEKRRRVAAEIGRQIAYSEFPSTRIILSPVL
jgi:hypothetical protein